MHYLRERNSALHIRNCRYYDMYDLITTNLMIGIVVDQEDMLMFLAFYI
jgi:hypothetical protein